MIYFIQAQAGHGSPLCDQTQSDSYGSIKKEYKMKDNTSFFLWIALWKDSGTLEKFLYKGQGHTLLLVHVTC